MHIENNGIRPVIPGQAETGIALAGQDTLIISFPEKFQEYFCKVQVILNNKGDPVIFLYGISVISRIFPVPGAVFKICPLGRVDFWGFLFIDRLIKRNYRRGSKFYGKRESEPAS